MRTGLSLTLAAALLASGCVTVFPKAEPARLYKLAPQLEPAESQSGPKTVILKGPTTFTRAASGDSIMTFTGGEMAAIAGARWAAPVQMQFDEALVAAFDSESTVHLMTRGGGEPAAMTLRVEVRTFEARYLAGPESAPTVVIEVRAVVDSLGGRFASGSQVFRAETAASENRVGPIVEAYNTATADILKQITGWTAGRVATGPLSPS